MLRSQEEPKERGTREAQIERGFVHPPGDSDLPAIFGDPTILPIDTPGPRRGQPPLRRNLCRMDTILM